MAEAKTIKSSNEIKVADLLAAGVHFGHQTRRWNPKMAPYIFASKNGVHVLDLVKTDEQIKVVLKFVSEITSRGGKILFVGTKRQARPIVSAAASEAGMPYVTHRWLGGMLTNLNTIQGRITAYNDMTRRKESGEFTAQSKKEQSRQEKEYSKLDRLFVGLTDMRELPAAVFVVDVPREHIAIAEARRLNIPVIAMTDTNANPDEVDYIIAANDDAIGSINLITRAVASAAAAGATSYAARAKESKKEETK